MLFERYVLFESYVLLTCTLVANKSVITLQSNDNIYCSTYEKNKVSKDQEIVN